MFTSRVGEISFHILKNNFVDIYKVDKGIKNHEVSDTIFCFIGVKFLSVYC